MEFLELIVLIFAGIVAFSFCVEVYAGIIGIILINLVGQFVYFHIPFNVLTVLLFGIFRLPGLIIILIFLIF